MHNSLKIIKKIIVFLFRSTCFGHSCAHYQEPPNSAHTASSHRVSLGWLYPPALFCHYCRDSDSICHTVTAICRYRGRVGTGLSVLWVA
jgi:hypothetical protein